MSLIVDREFVYGDREVVCGVTYTEKSTEFNLVASSGKTSKLSIRNSAGEPTEIMFVALGEKPSLTEVFPDSQQLNRFVYALLHFWAAIELSQNYTPLNFTISFQEHFDLWRKETVTDLCAILHEVYRHRKVTDLSVGYSDFLGYITREAEFLSGNLDSASINYKQDFSKIRQTLKDKATKLGSAYFNKLDVAALNETIECGDELLRMSKMLHDFTPRLAEMERKVATALAQVNDSNTRVAKIRADVEAKFNELQQRQIEGEQAIEARMIQRFETLRAEIRAFDPDAERIKNSNINRIGRFLGQ